MNNLLKTLALEAWFLFVLPLVGMVLSRVLGGPGAIVYFTVFVIECWEVFAYTHYRYCRQEEFLQVLQTAGEIGAPVESVLGIYLKDRPNDGLHRFWIGSLLFFVFPGFYWFHRERRFDARVALVTHMLENGVPLDQALAEVPGVVTTGTALAITVGEFTGRLAEALRGLPRRLQPLWVELIRLLYPLSILTVLLSNGIFISVFVFPKFEKIFLDFRFSLPPVTRAFIDISRLFAHFGWLLPLMCLLLLVLVNWVIFSSWAKWHIPVVGRLYRLHVRGQFLHNLGLMLQSGKPLPQVLACVVESGFLPRVLEARVDRLAKRVEHGEPLVDSLAAQGLVTRSMRPLILASEKAGNLPWALQELGDTLSQRSARFTYRLTMVVFPLTILACSCLIALVALATFMPMIALMEKLGG